MAEHHRFPRWVGPILGAGVGVYLGIRTMSHIAGPNRWLGPVVGVIVGALGGGVLWLMDTPADEGREASAIGSVLAVLAVFPGVLPFIGLVFGVPAFVVNRCVSGWQNRASRLGLGVSVVLTIVLVVAWQVPLK